MLNTKQVMTAAMRGEATKVPFVPSIYEHGPRVIGCAPGDVCRSAKLTAQAALESWEIYGHDLVTVGIDIYNIEAEAFGCVVSEGANEAIPGVETHPLSKSMKLDSSGLEIPQPGPGNRMGLLTEACAEVAKKIGDHVWVNACMSGPFSQAVELRGFEQLIVDMITDPASVHALLDKTAELSRQQADRLSRVGCGLSIFESWATLPLISPEIFGEYVVPYNKRVIDHVRANFQTPPPAVIMGGNTAILMDYFIAVGTSLVVADFNTDFDFMRDKTKGREMLVRGCVDPKAIERGDWELIGSSIEKLAEKSKGMKNFVWGCGAVSYNTSVENLLKFKELCVNASI